MTKLTLDEIFKTRPGDKLLIDGYLYEIQENSSIGYPHDPDGPQLAIMIETGGIVHNEQGWFYGHPLTFDRVSRAQLSIAHRYAVAYGHLWGSIPWRIVDRIFDESLDNANLCATIARHAESYDETSMGGMDQPTIDANGCIVHTTGTGRTHWSIARGGTVTIEIRRPFGTCMVATIAANGELYEIRPGEMAHGERHLSALHEALQVLVAGWICAKAMAHMWMSINSTNEGK
jgi:hypothetical protein